MNHLNNQLAGLKQMTPTQLWEKYLELFGEPARTGNKDFLAKRLAWRIQSLAEGGLSERAKRRAAELAHDADIRMTIPKAPAASGGGTFMTAPLCAREAVPIPGTLLTRHYKGRLLSVTVLPNGFDYDGTVYRSLSAVAKEITGTHWNGHLFFGLRDGKKA